METATATTVGSVDSSARGARSVKRARVSVRVNRRCARTRRARRRVLQPVPHRESCVVGLAAPAALRVRCAAAMGRPAQRLALRLESCVALLVALRARSVEVMGKRVAVRLVRRCVARRGYVPPWGPMRTATVAGMPVPEVRPASTASAPAQ
jgi:hypothetical protein